MRRSSDPWILPGVVLGEHDSKRHMAFRDFERARAHFEPQNVERGVQLCWARLPRTAGPAR